MARDYAHKKTGTKGKARKPPPNPYKIILFTLLIVGVLYFLNQTGELQQLKQQVIAAMAPAPRAKSQIAPQMAAQQPRFEFYTLLPKNNPNGSIVATKPAATPTVSVTTTSRTAAISPNSAMSSPTMPTTASNPPPPPKEHTLNQAKGHYILQVASFRTMGEADNLKAKLVFLGLDVAIEKFNNHGQEWYRVKVGPYSSSSQANAARQRLLKQKYNAMVQHVIG